MLHFRNLRSSLILQNQLFHLSRRRSSQSAVDLSYTSIIPENGNTNENPLVILHGLLFVWIIFRWLNANLCNWDIRVAVVRNGTGGLFWKHSRGTCLRDRYMPLTSVIMVLHHMRGQWPTKPWLKIWISLWKVEIWRTFRSWVIQCQFSFHWYLLCVWCCILV